MGAGDTPECPPEKEEEAVVDAAEPLSLPAVEAESFSDVLLTDAPILLLVYFHKAHREELYDLHRLALVAWENVSKRRELIIELRQRFDFLKLAQKYHSALEDEVIFLALDAHIKNVVYKYSLEHDSIDDLFDAIFHCLDMLMEEREDGSEQYQELVLCIGTMYSFIYQHMLKEEEQVFPLLMKQFSPKEQASLVWQFFCSIPVILLENLLPWMISFLSPEKRLEVMSSIKEIVPQEKVLSEVVISWLHRDDQSPYVAFTNIRKEYHNGCMKMYRAQNSVGISAVEYLHLWHLAIQKDLKETLEEAYQKRKSISFLDVDSIVLQLKFLAEVLIFYCTALKKFFYPVLNDIADNHPLMCSSEKFLMESRIESLHQLIHCNFRNGLALSEFVEMLCQELESFVMDITKYFSFQEIEVFPLISKNCSNDTQLQLLYTSLHLMPLGLLKCVIPWFAAHISESVSRSTFQSIDLPGDTLANQSFASLLLGWFHTGYSGKTSSENFGKNLQKLFKSRNSLLCNKIKEDVMCSSLHSKKQPCSCGGSISCKTEPISGNQENMLSSCSSSVFYKAETCETFYASETNLHLLLPTRKRLLQPFPKLSCGQSSTISSINEQNPMDFIFCFHKALKKDLEHLVSGSAQLIENVSFLMEFNKHFHLLRLRYQFHSDSEDDIAFPALEAKEVPNISKSYSIDHKLEVKYFSEISLILEKISKMHITVLTVDSSMQNKRMEKYNRLCMKLHRTCKSMHKLLSDHIHYEEIELWPLFRECFSIKEQEKIVGLMLGKARAEMLQDIIPWLISSLTPEEQQAMMSLLNSVTKNTMFNEWLGEWWEGYDTPNVKEESSSLPTADPLEIVSRYLFNDTCEPEGAILCEKDVKFSQRDSFGANADMIGKWSLKDKENAFNGDEDNKSSNCEKLVSENESKRYDEGTNIIVDKINGPGQPLQLNQMSMHQEHHLTMTQDDLEAAIRKVSRDSSLDPQKKSYIMQNLLTSRWIAQQRRSKSEAIISNKGEEIPGQHPSYFDSKGTLGCKHYKRKCKLVTPCCNKLYTCIRCHDEEADHSIDRKAITKMMCMKCLAIQPLGQACSTLSCNSLSMGRYYCKICKLFDDDREIYHCPFCNLCRVGKGLGIDYFHCMNCNACMARSLLLHTCREKCLEENCPICHDYLLTSNIPVKSLPCGHVMHSTCFQDYTCTHYICPICSKSLGDMQVYFKMLDALLAEEKMPDEYFGKTQAILCNDCEKKGGAPFHWHYHKCQYCGSYNTRLL